MNSASVVLENWYLGAFASLVLCYALPLLTAGRSALVYFRRARRSRKLADDAIAARLDETATLDVGDTVLHGTVEYPRDADRAVVATVEQTGSEAESSGSWSVSWEEVRRSIEVVPFYVVHASQARVRIEPQGRVKLEAELIATVRVDTTHRKRVARLLPDDTVWVMGVLGRGHDPETGGGYRDGASWVMRPPAGEPMTVTRFPPERRLERQASHARVFAWLMLVLFGVMMLGHLQYHALLLTGRAATATVTDKHVKRGSGDNPDTYVFDVGVSDGRETFSDTWEVSYSTFDPAKPGETFPAFASFTLIKTSLPGTAARALGVPTVATSVVWLVLVITALATARKRYWYDGGRVKDSATGRLA